MKQVGDKEFDIFISKHKNIKRIMHISECFIYSNDVLIAKIEIESIGKWKNYISELPN